MPEGTDPLFVNFRTGQPLLITQGISVGGITTSMLADGAVTTDKIADNAVTNAKLADMAEALIKGRASGAGTGDPQDLTAAQVRTILGYEEGTWTPALAFGGAATGITYATQVGSYIKFANIVHIWGRLTIVSNGTATGDATITGFPFSTISTANLFQLGGLLMFGAAGTTGGLVINMAPSVSVATLFHTITGSGGALNETNILDNTDMVFDITYRTE